MNLSELTPKTLRKAAKIQEQISKLQAVIAGMLNGGPPKRPYRKRHHRVSAASRRRLAKIAKARWAAAKKAGRKGL